MNLKAILLLFVLGLLTQSILASNDVINVEDHAEGLISLDDAAAKSTLTKKDFKNQLRAEKKQLRTEKRVAWVMKIMEKKMMKKAKKAIGGLDDPVDKWFWYWVIAWGAALLMNILFWAIATSGAGFYSGGWIIFGLLSTLLWLGGVVALIIWLVNKFG